MHLWPVLFFFYNLNAYAYQEDPNEIMVTADRIQTTSSRSVSGITQITKDQIEQSNSSSIDEILSHNSSINLVHSGPTGSSSAVFLRGTDTSHTLVVLDGIILNDPTNPNRQFDFSNLSSINIDKIEVLKGSQGLLYGTNAIGGVIVLTTKKGDPGNIQPTTINFSTGSNSTFSTAISSEINKSDQHFIWGLDYLTSKGFSAADDPTHINDRDGTKNLSADLALNGSLNAHDNYEAKLRIQTATTDLDKGAGPYGDDPNYTSKSQEIYSKLEFNHIWEERLQSKFYYTYIEHFRRNFDSPDPFQTYDGSNYARGHVHSFNLENTFVPNERLIQDFNFGFDNESDDFHNNSNSHFFLYNKLENEKFTLNFGGRIDYNEIFHEYFTYKAGISKQFSNYSLHTNFSTGYLAPTLNQLFVNKYGNPNLLPEKSQNVEVGIDLKFNLITSSTSLFYTYIQDRLSYELTTLKNINSGRALTKGIEQEFSGNLTPNLQVHLTMNYNEAVNLTNGQRLARRPDFQATDQLSYVTDLNRTTLEYKFVGRRNDVDNAGNILSDRSYSILNLNFEHNLNQFKKIYFKVQNLLNNNYQEIWGYNTGGRLCTFGMNMKF